MALRFVVAVVVVADVPVADIPAVPFQTRAVNSTVCYFSEAGSDIISVAVLCYTIEAEVTKFTGAWVARAFIHNVSRIAWVIDAQASRLRPWVV